MSVDLHLHTYHSDGSWSPSEVVANAIRLKLSAIAITDHDTVAGIEEARAAANGSLEIISGIEINTVLKQQDGSNKDIHILGYFIDAENSSLKAVMKRQQDARNRLVDEIIKKVQSCGINLTMADVRECAGNGSIGRPHITRAIVKVGGAKNLTAAYERFMTRTSPDYVPRHSIEPQEAIAAIRDAGGISSIAHPGKNQEIEPIILMLKECGLNSVEVFHRSHNLTTVKRYLKFAAAHGMLITGGSDCHGPSDGYPASIGTVSVSPEVVRNLKLTLKAAS